MVGLYPSIPHEAGLQALEEALENKNHKQISTKKLKMPQFVLRNSFFEFNNDVFQQIQQLQQLGQQLGQNLNRHMHVFSWIKLKLNF